jgi:hypothetical protein
MEISMVSGFYLEFVAGKTQPARLARPDGEAPRQGKDQGLIVTYDELEETAQKLLQAIKAAVAQHAQ